MGLPAITPAPLTSMRLWQDNLLKGLMSLMLCVDPFHVPWLLFLKPLTGRQNIFWASGGPKPSSRSSEWLDKGFLSSRRSPLRTNDDHRGRVCPFGSTRGAFHTGLNPYIPKWGTQAPGPLWPHKKTELYQGYSEQLESFLPTAWMNYVNGYPPVYSIYGRTNTRLSSQIQPKLLAVSRPNTGFLTVHSTISKSIGFEVWGKRQKQLWHRGRRSGAIRTRGTVVATALDLLPYFHQTSTPVYQPSNVDSMWTARTPDRPGLFPKSNDAFDNESSQVCITRIFDGMEISQ